MLLVRSLMHTLSSTPFGRFHFFFTPFRCLNAECFDNQVESLLLVPMRRSSYGLLLRNKQHKHTMLCLAEHTPSNRLSRGVIFPRRVLASALAGCCQAAAGVLYNYKLQHISRI
jgi:hypothetical protein